MKKILYIFLIMSLLIFVSCSSDSNSNNSDEKIILNEETETEEQAAKISEGFFEMDKELKDGTYEGESEGEYGKIEVEVKVESGKIADINIKKSTMSHGMEDIAIKELPSKVIENNVLNGIDMVSSATVSSEQLLDAISNALEKAIK